MNICFFSDDHSSNFKPLTLTRPLDDLRIGIFTIREKWLKLTKPDSWIRQIDEYLEPLFPIGSINENEEYSWINTRFIPSPEIVNSIQKLRLGEALLWNDELVAIQLSSSNTKSLIKSKKQPTWKCSSKLESAPISIEYFWDLLLINSDQIAFDIQLLPASFSRTAELDYNVILKNQDQIFIHETATVEPGSIILAIDGPVYIGPDAKIEAGSIIKGPVAICEKAEIKMGGRMFNGTTIGPVCKVGGEVNNCIFHSYSNKAHDGFTGNSIIGQWGNFGAATNTSNLKSNYSRIHLPDWNTGKISDGVQFFGTVFGDFSKTAINTNLNTGTICGVSSNVFCSGFPPKVIPSFSWLGEETQTYEFDKAVVAMRAMMQRRGTELTPEYINMMRHIFNLQYSASS